MGRRFVTPPLFLHLSFCFFLIRRSANGFLLLIILVLREIEEEDSLWRQKSGKKSPTPTPENTSQDDKNLKSTKHDSTRPQTSNSASAATDEHAKGARFF